LAGGGQTTKSSDVQKINGLAGVVNESVLWNQLKSKNLEGKKFRRQQSIGKLTTPAGKVKL